jgi:hypothetical protein
MALAVASLSSPRSLLPAKNLSVAAPASWIKSHLFRLLNPE